MRVCGPARIGRRTKELAKRLRPGDIAVIAHQDLDEVAARALLKARPRAVVNCCRSLSGRYPSQGPLVLLEGGVPLLDQVGWGVLEEISEGERLEVAGDRLLAGGRLLARGEPLTSEGVKISQAKSMANFEEELSRFVENSMDYARREAPLILGALAVPELKTSFNQRQALLVVRGPGYQEDLRTLRTYIREVRPVLVGVDGGADALWESGYRPHLIIGDMDSVSDTALKCGAELLVHAYPDGRAPGMERLSKLGLEAAILPSPGTSEDVAVLLAHQLGSKLIVAVGLHSCMLDFLEKGRPGMGSTVLVRMKVGNILVDAKGVNQLYRQRLQPAYVAGLVGAALLPLLAAAAVSPLVGQLARLFWLRMRVWAAF